MEEKITKNRIMLKSQENTLKPWEQADWKKIILPAALFAFMLLVMFYWRNTWDDSAITLAFSRNLVKYGDIIPSQFSDRVEGYSTFLWMIINASFFRLGFDERTVLVVAKSISTFFSLVNILIFWQLVKENISQPFYQTIILVLFTINLQTIISATFGMETALYAFLVLMSYSLYKKRDQSNLEYVGFTFASSLLILIRHEGPLFLIPFVVETLRKGPRQFLREPFLYVWVIIFLGYHAWHYSFFGELLTNPMIAKRQPPYLPEFSSVLDAFLYYLFPVSRFVAVYPFLVLLTGVYFIQLRSLTPVLIIKNKTQPLIYGIALIGVLVMLLTGRSWNADADRLSYPALAFIFLAIAQIVDRIPVSKLIPNSRGVFAISLWLGVFINIAATARSFTANRQFLLTVEEFEKTSKLVTLTQSQLNLDRATFAGADMGSLLLFEGDGKRVIDLGLLCNTPLAANGFGIVDDYVLQQERPEIIEIHDNWVEPFEKSTLFHEMYVPVRVIAGENQSFFFIRNDLVPKINNVKETEFMQEQGIEPNLSRVLSTYENYLTISVSR